MANVSWKTIADDFAQRIRSGELSPGSRLPSGDEIAQSLGVARHIVHRAIDELQREGLVERRRRWGTIVSGKKPSEIGRVMFLVDQFSQTYNFPPASLIRGMNEGLGEDVDLILAECKGDPHQEERQLRRVVDRVDGLIVCPTSHPSNTPLLQALIDRGFPLVVLDRVPEGLSCDAVVSDNATGTRRAIEDLAGRGHRQIAFFSFLKPNYSSVVERHTAYKGALADLGVSDTSAITRWFAKELHEHPAEFVQNVSDALHALSTRPTPVTAIFCVEDSVAAATLRACDQLGIRVPEDLEIVTFNDWPPLLLQAPWRTHRIVQRHHELGFAAARMLLQGASRGEELKTLLRVPPDFVAADAGLAQTTER